MRKEKSKSGSSSTGQILTIMIGLLSLMCLFVFLRPGVKPLGDAPTPMPTPEPFRLTSLGYLSDWDERPISPTVNNTDVVSSSQTLYTSHSIDPLAIAQITFAQLKTANDVREAFYHPSLPSWFGIIEDAIHIESLNADRFDVMCTYIKPSSPEETATSDYPSCRFIAQYGLCVLEATSTIHEPAVTPNDFKQLIVENIDPQMAAWNGCYPNRQTE